MKHLNVKIDVYEGFSHCGDISTDGKTTLEISDEEAEQLLALIKEHHGKVDEKILEEEMPSLFEQIDLEGCRIDWAYWVIEGYEKGYYEDYEAGLSEEEILERYGDEVECGNGYNGCEFTITADCIS